MAVTAKNGKYFYAWSKILSDGSLYLPEQALLEYKIPTGSNVILMSGSHTVKGFSVVCKELIDNSPLAKVFASLPQLLSFSVPPGQTIQYKGRMFCWTYLGSDHYIHLPLQTWDQLDLTPGDQLLSMRATHLAFNALADGPYIELAKQVRGVPVYE